ncbi:MULTISPECIES: response regulator [unclassified Pseudomonas]|uniref:response regulator n=1 Tax=unclassified Pseudomonas TaxID=196821 RepID=UPI000BC63801|nr:MULTISPECIES: response regulator [unclassified Pseudomonas]PVZ19538.1 response regulator receiver domain-containing protein [Pseudomonas sp. URIL14HWK12:I12]PVZ22877.1 response regulator receiver domain-containing protein [Pseudomonas sp. URIL14HWK12:I10]PVZ37493.1 response regulator receiver domain-containing protein [Pseudomonas sp. URIL14HWK12:I11]SNZ14917.1 Response regulator containing CheY-like receiver, AAA-type ATPase, and DNA-binding domains [Pseudomonas sp. URIL14HWK12:I9]
MNNALIVEDEFIARQLLTDVISGLGLQVTAVQTADEGRQEFSKDPQHWALVVTDFFTPGLSTGSDLVRDIQSMRSDCPVIVSSGYLDHDDMLAADNIRLLIKPWTISHLELIVTELTGQEASQGRDDR